MSLQHTVPFQINKRSDLTAGFEPSCKVWKHVPPRFYTFPSGINVQASTTPPWAHHTRTTVEDFF
eukprot:5246234-Amphidinium_carterae.1